MTNPRFFHVLEAMNKTASKPISRGQEAVLIAASTVFVVYFLGNVAAILITGYPQ